MATRSGRSGGGGGGGSAGGSAGFGAQCRGDFGANASAQRFEAFMAATYEFDRSARDLQRTLLDACREMGQRLEMPAAQLAGDGPEGTRAVCNAVSTQLRQEMAAIRQGSEVRAEMRSQPPRCEARFDVYAECAARCDVNVEPGQVEMVCTGGELRGGCSGSCSGRCAVDASARCEGRCEGMCDGTCSATAADGSCAGQCDGTCRGQCVAEVSGQCQGECRGECSVEWERPRCTGEMRPPQVSAECRAACDAQVNAQVECQPGRAELVVTGGMDAEAEARAARVREAIAIGMGTVITVRERVQRLNASGREVVSRMRELPSAIRTLGVTAAACSTAALANFQQSMSSVSVTLEVSVSVSASASASAG